MIGANLTADQIRGWGEGKEIEKENARKGRNKKTAPLLQIYVSDVRFWSRRGIVY